MTPCEADRRRGEDYNDRMKWAWLVLLVGACVAPKTDPRYPQPGDDKRAWSYSECTVHHTPGTLIERTTCDRTDDLGWTLQGLGTRFR